MQEAAKLISLTQVTEAHRVGILHPVCEAVWEKQMCHYHNDLLQAKTSSIYSCQQNLQCVSIRQYLK